ncbi:MULTISPECIES: hypothetical protein [unclassified Lysobacter]
MTEPTSTAAVNTQDVYQLNARVLTWILSVRNVNDLTAQSIATRTGLKFWFDPDNPHHFSASGKLVAPWVYVVESLSTRPGPPPHSIGFEMWVPGNKDADRTEVCIGLDHYKQPLTAAGFKSVRLVDSQSLEYWSFSNDKVAVKVHLRGKTKRYDDQLCVSKVIVSASA